MDYAHLLDLLRPATAPGTPRRQGLYAALRQAVLDGRLPAGTHLPASRTLAAELVVARNTVIHAYEQLLTEGYLVADRRATRVAALPLGDAPRAEPSVPDAPDSAPAGPPAPLPGLAPRAARINARRHGQEGPPRPFSPGVPDLGRFPFAAWRTCLDAAWREATPSQLHYSPPGGDPLLREAIAHHLAVSRGVRCTPRQVIVTPGIQGAIAVCAWLLAEAGATAWLENPGYPGARSAFAWAGLNVRGIAVDGQGLAPTAADWAEAPPRLIYLTPAHQYPLGTVLSLERRLDLLTQARRHGTWLLEDDYDAEFRYESRPLPALQGLTADAPVIYLGTFSKTLLPGLRLAYVVAPEAIAPDLARAVTDLLRPGQGVEQQALATFIAKGRFAAHLQRMRRLYAARQEALRRLLGERLPAVASIPAAVTGGAAGLHLTLALPPHLADRTAVAALRRRSLDPRPVSAYCLPGSVPPGGNGLVLGYGNTDTAILPAAVEQLAAGLAEAAGHG
ncbi:GntR family transcriptional regulator / MocR family aminotransferase [Oryzomicrobium terrae]|uniref:GntR family transcriptional regulator / MocR family aminotransferase n=1 Tax=Oryzomicrobium terrae TaxID=1735038 RepID=A0A5C1E4M9_9RHOO|nr:PLP-dependent aminotransferase family protein [Oryzomicrobium terrae]QEL63810.1 GntR family transcriptional regulator / MocR family aminotransferase [Oryzomicrobium terrae]